MNKRIKKKKQNIYRVVGCAELLTSRGETPESPAELQNSTLVRATGNEKLIREVTLIEVKPYYKKNRRFFRKNWVKISCLQKVFEN